MHASVLISPKARKRTEPERREKSELQYVPYIPIYRLRPIAIFPCSPYCPRVGRGGLYLSWLPS